MNLSDIELPSNHKFGFFFSGIFLAASTYFYFEENVTLAYSLTAIGILFLGISLISPNTLLPLNKLWMRFGLLLGIIVSPIVLGLIFFGLFTPISLMMRLFGRDELRLKLINRTSHWKERSADNVQHDAFKYQF